MMHYYNPNRGYSKTIRCFSFHLNLIKYRLFRRTLGWHSNSPPDYRNCKTNRGHEIDKPTLRSRTRKLNYSGRPLMIHTTSKQKRKLYYQTLAQDEK